MVIVVTPALVALIGLLTYVLSANPNFKELGRIAFAVGLFATLIIFGAFSSHLR